MDTTEPSASSALRKMAAALRENADADRVLAARISGKQSGLSEQAIHDWFTSHSSAAVARVIATGQSVIDERMADGVFE